MSLYTATSPEMSSPFMTNVYGCKATWRMEKTSLGLCVSKEASIWTFIVTSDYDVANYQQFLNVIMFNDLKFRYWRCCFCVCHRKTSAGTLFLGLFTKQHIVSNADYMTILCTKICSYWTRIVGVIWKWNRGPVFRQCILTSKLSGRPNNIELLAHHDCDVDGTEAMQDEAVCNSISSSSSSSWSNGTMQLAPCTGVYPTPWTIGTSCPVPSRHSFFHLPLPFPYLFPFSFPGAFPESSKSCKDSAVSSLNWVWGETPHVVDFKLLLAWKKRIW